MPNRMVSACRLPLCVPSHSDAMLCSSHLIRLLIKSLTRDIEDLLGGRKKQTPDQRALHELMEMYIHPQHALHHLQSSSLSPLQAVLSSPASLRCVKQVGERWKMEDGKSVTYFLKDDGLCHDDSHYEDINVRLARLGYCDTHSSTMYCR